MNKVPNEGWKQAAPRCIFPTDPLRPPNTRPCLLEGLHACKLCFPDGVVLPSSQRCPTVTGWQAERPLKVFRTRLDGASSNLV